MSDKTTKPEQKSQAPAKAVQENDDVKQVSQDADETYPTLPKIPNVPLPEPAPRFDPDAELEISADGKTFKGNKSTERFPIDQKGHVIVRQVSIQSLNGGMVEVPNTEQTQTYAPNVYDKMVENGFFSDSKLKTTVLHQPAK